MNARSAAVVLVWGLLCADLKAEVRLDPAFDSGPGTDVFVEHAVPLEDGRILACGAFLSYNGEPVSYLMRLNENGSRDETFATNVVDYWVRHLAVQPDGKIVIGGAFANVGGASRNLIARLNADGTLDPTFDPGRGFEDKLVPPDPNPPYVFWLTLQPDGKVLAVGSFAKFNGQPAPGIARLNPDGSLDSSFKIGSGLNSWGRFVLVQPDDRILVSGWFTDFNGFTCNRMVRLEPDGTPDSSFRPFFGDKTAIYSAALLPEGKMIVSGHTKNEEGLFDRKMARLNADGTEDTAFLAQTNERTESILIQPDGKILVCGWFDSANDTPRGRIARFNEDGTLDESFRADAEFFIWNMALDQKGRLLVVGGFPRILGVERQGIARLIIEDNPKPQSDDSVAVEDFEMVNGTFQVKVLTGEKGTYFLERRPGFVEGEWETIDTLPANGALRTLVDLAPAAQFGCYRVRWETD